MLSKLNLGAILPRKVGIPAAETNMSSSYRWAQLPEDSSRKKKNYKAGDVAVLKSAVDLAPKQGTVFVEVHPSLYEVGVPSFRRLWTEDDKGQLVVTVQVLQDTKIDELEYLAVVALAEY